MAARFTPARILGRRDLTDRITEFRIGFANGAALPAPGAGAHVALRFGGSQGAFLRHYSLIGPLSSATRTEPFWRIAVQREPRRRGSDFIHRTFRQGTELLISRAQTPFRMVDTGGPVLLIAGGIGITAILPMLRSCRLRGVDVRMLYAGRGRDAMAYVDEVEALGGDRVHLQTEGVPDLPALLAAQRDATTAYICGPGPMLDAARAAAAQLGWAPERLRHEIFNAAHRPEDTALTVTTTAGRRVSVGAGTTILDALEAAGVETYSDCRRGECGLCVTELRTPARIDHRDRFLTRTERAAGTRLAICCSRPLGDVLDLDI